MLQFVFKRLLIAIPIFIGITVVVYTLSCLAPGNVVDIMAAQGNMSQEAYDAAIAKYGLDKPIIVRYVNWLGDLFQGDLGTSSKTSQPVMSMISDRIVPSLTLTLTAVILSILISTPLGVMAAYKPYSVWDNISSAIAFVGASTPNFFISLILVYFLAAKLGWFPAQGMYAVNGDRSFRDLVWHITLPAFVLCIQLMGSYIKQTRGSVLEVLNEEFVKTARAKGLREQRVVIRHALRNAWIPIVTAVGLNIPFIIGGAVVTEQIFAWPGIGSLMISAINTRDYPLIMGITVMISVVVLLANIALDVLYAYLDPRIGFRKQEA